MSRSDRPPHEPPGWGGGEDPDPRPPEGREAAWRQRLTVDPDRELREAIRDHNDDRMAAWLARGAGVDARDEYGQTPLFAAVFGEVDPLLASLLLDHGADVRARDLSGVTPLHWAAMYGSEAHIALLLDRGAEIDAQSEEGWTALHEAARMGRIEAATILVARGADTRIRNDRGWTPLDAARDNHLLGGLREALERLLGDPGSARVRWVSPEVWRPSRRPEGPSPDPGRDNHADGCRMSGHPDKHRRWYTLVRVSRGEAGLARMRIVDAFATRRKAIEAFLAEPDKHALAVVPVPIPVKYEPDDELGYRPGTFTGCTWAEDLDRALDEASGRSPLVGRRTMSEPARRAGDDAPAKRPEEVVDLEGYRRRELDLDRGF